MKSGVKSFYNAFRGIWLCFAGERHFRFHVIFSVFVFYLARFFGLSAVEYALLALTCGLVILAEAINTSIENAVNLSCKTANPTARDAKDISAGAVLISAVIAVAVGLILLYRPQGFAAMYGYYASAPVRLIVLATAIIAGLAVIFALPVRKKSGDCQKDNSKQ